MRETVIRFSIIVLWSVFCLGVNCQQYQVPYQLQQPFQTAQTQQQKIVNNQQFQQRLLASSFLPGIGAFQNSQRIHRSQETDQYSTPGAHVKSTPTPFPFPQNVLGSSANANKGGKCTYVQMKGGPMPTGEECHKGGMACEKQCGQGSGPQQCRTVMEEVCGDVAKPQCVTVMESVCEPVQETVCDEVQQQKQADTR